MGSKILLVDDSNFIRFQFRNLLESEGYEVYEAAEGRQVTNQNFDRSTRLADIDLVLLDLYLPDIDGTKVLKFITSNHPNIPVMMISAEKQKNKIIELIDMGARDYLVKPVDTLILISRIQKHLSEEKSIITSRKEEGEKTDADLERVMLEEIDRAIRSNSSLTILRVIGEIEFLETLYEISREKLRRIDTTHYIKNELFLILPVTDEQGSEIVKDKIVGQLNDSSQISFKRIIFPRDVSSKELIEGYKVESIYQELVDKINQN